MTTVSAFVTMVMCTSAAAPLPDGVALGDELTTQLDGERDDDLTAKPWQLVMGAELHRLDARFTHGVLGMERVVAPHASFRAIVEAGLVVPPDPLAAKSARIGGAILTGPVLALNPQHPVVLSGYALLGIGAHADDDAAGSAFALQRAWFHALARVGAAVDVHVADSFTLRATCDLAEAGMGWTRGPDGAPLDERIRNQWSTAAFVLSPGLHLLVPLGP